MLNRSGVISSAIGLALGLGCVALAGGNGGFGAAESGVGVVDMEAIFRASGGRELVMQKTLTEFRAVGVGRLNDVEGAPFLTADERREYLDLLSFDKATEQQTERIKALKEISSKRAEDLQALEMRKAAELAPADKQRMRELVDERNAMEQVMPGIQEVVRIREEQQADDLRHEILLKIRSTVAQVAKEKGCGQVFDAAAMPFTGEDLTQLVVQKLRPKPAK